MTDALRQTVRCYPVVVLLGLALLAGGCSLGGSPEELELQTAVVSGDTFRPIGVWAPMGAAQDPWPVVYLMHGIGPDPHGMDTLAEKIAERGNVVFNLDWDLQGDLTDLVCAYRQGLSIAPDYGGDPDHSVVVGHSYGATVALLGATSVDPDVSASASGVCTLVDGRPTLPTDPGTALPDVLVMIAPCLFEYQDRPLETQPQGGNTDLSITIVSGEDDETCQPWQQEDAVDLLEGVGYETTLVTVPSATHLTLIHLDIVDGVEVVVEDSPAGQHVTDAIISAIADDDG